MILLAYRHGLRASEVCTITMDDVCLEARRILCRRGKGSITNWQEMTADEISAVKAWLRERPQKNSPYLFVSRKGPAVSRKHFYRVVRRHALAVGIAPERAHPHSLKHALGTHLANSRVPVQVIQQRLGHRSINNTMKDLAIASEYVNRAVREAMARGAVV